MRFDAIGKTKVAAGHLSSGVLPLLYVILFLVVD